MADSEPQSMVSSRPRRTRRPAPDPEERIRPLTDPSRHAATPVPTTEGSNSQSLGDGEQELHGEGTRDHDREQPSVFTQIDRSGASPTQYQRIFRLIARVKNIWLL